MRSCLGVVDRVTGRKQGGVACATPARGGKKKKPVGAGKARNLSTWVSQLFKGVRQEVVASAQPGRG